MNKPRLMQGNEACTEGALAAGVRFFAGYPITPSTEVAELSAEKLPKLGGTFIQMEDEIASMGAVCGASLAGVKSMTATSGPGFSLKQELIGYASMAEIPVVIVNVQRSGPSTGLPTAPSQGDVMQTRWGSHGDRGVIALSPGSVREAFDVGVHAVNFSERFRTPVVILMDEVIGHMREKVTLPTPEEIEIVDRKRTTLPPEEFQAYKPDEDEVPAMMPFGEGYYHHVTGLMHSYSGQPALDSKTTKEVLSRLHTKIDRAIDDITLYTEHFLDDAEILIITYGGSARPALAAVKQAREQGIKVGMLKLITIWPFPKDIVQKAAATAKMVIVPEMNYGQLVGEIERYVDQGKVIPVNRYDGHLFHPNDIFTSILKAQGGAE